MAITIITGDVATDTINQSQRILDMDPKIEELEPNAAPLTTLLKKIGKRKATQPKVEWMEVESMPRFDVLSASAASNATALPVTNGAYFRVGDVLRLQAGDAAEVTATAAGALTVTRGLGSVTKAAAASADEVFIVGNLNAEGACLREIKTPKVANTYNYAEIVRHPYGVTGTEAATQNYSGSELTRLKGDTAVEHMRTWEQILLTGPRGEDTTTAGRPKRTAGGLTEFITTNVTNVGGTLTEAAFLTFLRTAFRYGSSTKVLAASPLVLGAIDGFARTNLKVNDTNAVDGTYGVRLKRYESTNGTLLLAREQWLQDSATYKGHAFLLDLDSIKYAPLRDTMHLTDRQPPDCDRLENEWFTEATFVVAHERRHAILKGVTG